MNKEVYYKSSLDMIEDGVIAVDSDKNIQVYNRRAQEIFGISAKVGPEHPAGQIARGDIVVLADNKLGADDGNLEPEDLSVLGMPVYYVNKEDALIVVGKYKDNKAPCYYKIASGGKMEQPLMLNCKMEQISLRITIDDISNKITIYVNDKLYEMKYVNYIGHLVIIDGNTGAVKFYQNHGYTARDEDAKKIIKGKNFLAKGPNSPKPVIIGQHFSNIHPDNEVTYYLDAVLKGQAQEIRGKELSLNGIWVRSSTFPIYNENSGKIRGAAIILRDISEIKRLEKQVLNREFKYPAFNRIIGSSLAIMEPIRMAQRVSKSNSTVLLLGESGTGKGLFARAIHDNSRRVDKPFITVNMAAIPGNLIESELFGYEEGAFTGARKGGKAGKFSLAHEGTIFLDEIGDMDYYLQAKILNVLQDNCFYPVGSSRSIKVDVRVIAATNKDLKKEVQEGRFREELYYRLNVVAIHLPTLSHRKEDIRELVEQMMPKIQKKVGREKLTISPEVYEDFYSYHWPGNIRELENVLERAVNIAEGNVINRSALPAYIRKNNSSNYLKGDIRTLKEYVQYAEKEAIIRALEATNYNKTAAIKYLGIGRTAFYKKVGEYNIMLSN